MLLYDWKLSRLVTNSKTILDLLSWTVWNSLSDIFTGGNSSILLDVKPWDDETGMKKLQERLNGLAMIAIENAMLRNIQYEELIDQFALVNASRKSRFGVNQDSFWRYSHELILYYLLYYLLLMFTDFIFNLNRAAVFLLLLWLLGFCAASFVGFLLLLWLFGCLVVVLPALCVHGFWWFCAGFIFCPLGLAF